MKWAAISEEIHLRFEICGFLACLQTGCKVHQSTSKPTPLHHVQISMIFCRLIHILDITTQYTVIPT